MSDENRSESAKAADAVLKNAYFYFLRDNRNQIFGGAYIYKDAGTWCRGISLWADTLDEFDRNECRRVAKKRLMRAVLGRKTDYPINFDRSESTKKLMENYGVFHGDWKHKAVRGAVLTPKEKEIVGEPF
jgi:hypothetical protein